jgi:hypothetical protein
MDDDIEIPAKIGGLSEAWWTDSGEIKEDIIDEIIGTISLEHDDVHIFFPFAGDGQNEIMLLDRLRAYYHQQGRLVFALLLDVDSSPYHRSNHQREGVRFITDWNDVSLYEFDACIALNPICQPYFAVKRYPKALVHKQRVKQKTILKQILSPRNWS